MPQKPKKQSRTNSRSKVDLEAMMEEALVDAYGEEEQRVGFFTMVQDHLKLPLETKQPSKR